MRILYVLDQPVLCGGVKVVFQHAALLEKAGYDVSIAARGPKPHWSGFFGSYWNLNSGGVPSERQDLVIATYWTTLSICRKLELGPVAHFCQGYEGFHPHLTEQRSEIEEAYSGSEPTLVVSPHLGELLLRKFGRESRVASPPLVPMFSKRFRWGPRSKPRIMIHGIFECNWKGVETGLEAIKILREENLDCRLVRTTLIPLSTQENEFLKADRVLCDASPKEVARVTRDCDLLLFPSLSAEGFGLPLLEAMACGVPAVASRIPSVEYMTGGCLPMVEPGDAAGFAREAGRILRNRQIWRNQRAAGIERSRKFAPGCVTSDLIDGIEWACSLG